MAAKKSKVNKEKSVKNDELELARKAIHKKYGDILTTMDNKVGSVIPTIPTGSLGLDSALGRGGLAMGRVYELYGEPSGGKTTLAMSVIAQAQKKGIKCLFVDAERAADPKLFEAMGVNLTDLELIEGFTGDQNLNALEVMLKTGAFGVAVVDSVSALIPEAEAEASVEDQFMGIHARLMSKALRRLVPLAARTNTLLLFINQIRNKIGAYGDPEVTTGGVALDFYATGRIKVSGGSSKSSRIQASDGDVIGHHTKFLVKKNKLSKPYREAMVPLIYGVGYDIIWEVLTMSVDLGIVDKSGAWFSYGDKKIGQGEMRTLDFLRENPDVFNEIRFQVENALGLRDIYEQNS